MAFVPVSAFTGVRLSSRKSVCSTPSRAAKWSMSGAGKGFGGGEATRNPDATPEDPNDPKFKQTAIHKAETFAEYQARKAKEAAEKESK